MCAKEPTILVGQVRKQNSSTQNLQCKRKKIISKAFMLKNIQAKGEKNHANTVNPLLSPPPPLISLPLPPFLRKKVAAN